MGYGGAMDGCGRCMKFSLIIINLFSAVGGLILLGLGIWVLIDRTYADQLLSSNMFKGSVYVLIITGAAITFISILGCMGACKEVKCMLLTYYILVFIIFVTMLIGGILAYVFREKVQGSLEREMLASLSHYGNRQEYTQSWDSTQENLLCCGVKNYRDWDSRVPASCCKEAYLGKKLDCQSSQNPTTIYMEGCLQKTIDFFKHSALILGSVAIIVACILILALIFSCALFAKIE